VTREATLYDRLGGEAGIAALLDRFYARVLADPELSPFFADASMGHLRSMQRAFFSAALDGPVVYTGRTLAEVHYGRGIRPPHLRRFVDHLVATLRGLDVGEADVEAIRERISTYADEVTGDTSVDA